MMLREEVLAVMPIDKEMHSYAIGRAVELARPITPWWNFWGDTVPVGALFKVVHGLVKENRIRQIECSAHDIAYIKLIMR